MTNEDLAKLAYWQEQNPGKSWELHCLEQVRINLRNAEIWKKRGSLERYEDSIALVSIWARRGRLPALLASNHPLELPPAPSSASPPTPPPPPPPTASPTTAKLPTGPSGGCLKSVLRITVLFLSLVLGLSLLAAIFGEGGYVSDASVEACVRRGQAYFSEIGSFPRLSDGRDALTVARERCERTTTAFP